MRIVEKLVQLPAAGRDSADLQRMATPVSGEFVFAFSRALPC